MSNDIRDIIERLAVLEGRTTPTDVKHGLNQQQKSVPQMPALFKPRTQKILGGNANAKNPMSGYAVGGCEENAELEESQANEEKLLDKVKKSLTDYLSSIEDKYKDQDLKDKNPSDTDLKDKVKNNRDLVARQPELEAVEQLPAVQPAGEPGVSVKECYPIKSITMEDGRICEIHGDEHTGFEIRHGNRRLKSRFKNLDQAQMALEMYMARCKANDESADYMEER